MIYFHSCTKCVGFNLYATECVKACQMQIKCLMQIRKSLNKIRRWIWCMKTRWTRIMSPAPCIRTLEFKCHGNVEKTANAKTFSREWNNFITPNSRWNAVSVEWVRSVVRAFIARSSLRIQCCTSFIQSSLPILNSFQVQNAG